MSDVEEAFGIWEPNGSELWFVGVYLFDRAYGGPEEGGWYYDCGQLETNGHLLRDYEIPTPRSFLNLDDAHHFANQVNEWLDASINVGRHSISSVLSEGRYMALVMEGNLPTHFPERKPHYE